MKVVRTILFLAVAFPLHVLAQTCPFPAEPTLDPKKPVIVIDARNGSFEGARQYGVNDSTAVVVKNKNPFRYSYVLKIEESLIQEDAIGKFLAFAKIGTEAAPAPPAEGQPEVNPLPLAPGSPCAIAKDKLVKNQDKLHDAAMDLKSHIEHVIPEYENLTTDVKTLLLDPTADGPTLCKNAQQALQEIKGRTPFKGVEKLKELQDLIEAQTEALDNVPAGCTVDEKKFEAGIKAAKKVADWADERNEEIDKRLKQLDEGAENITTVLKHAAAFWESRALGPFLERTEAKISLTRKDKTVEDATAETIRPEVLVRFGAGKRFFMAGGIAASSADRTRYKVIDGFILDRDGNPVLDNDKKPTSGKVVGIEEDSVGRVSPVILLHGLLAQPNKGILSGIGVSLGVGAAGSDDTVLEFFAGPTFAFADNHLFVTVGAFRGTETKLAGDFYRGAEVKDGVTLSTFDRKTWTFGLGLSYRIP